MACSPISVTRGRTRTMPNGRSAPGWRSSRRYAALQTPITQPLAARVGIATGLVVVGDLIGEGAAQEEAVVGETPNLRRAATGVGPAGSVVIATHSSAPGRRPLRIRRPGSAGAQGLRRAGSGVARTRGERAESRFEARHGRQLDAAGWARAGDGSACSIAGGAPRRARAKWCCSPASRGSASRGSSRPCASDSRGGRATPLRYHSSPHHTNSALYPVIGQLERAAGFERDDAPEASWTSWRRCSPGHRPARARPAAARRAPRPRRPATVPAART